MLPDRDQARGLLRRLARTSLTLDEKDRLSTPSVSVHIGAAGRRIEGHRKHPPLDSFRTDGFGPSKKHNPRSVYKGEGFGETPFKHLLLYVGDHADAFGQDIVDVINETCYEAMAPSIVSIVPEWVSKGLTNLVSVMAHEWADANPSPEIQAQWEEVLAEIEKRGGVIKKRVPVEGWPDGLQFDEEGMPLTPNGNILVQWRGKLGLIDPKQARVVWTYLHKRSDITTPRILMSGQRMVYGDGRKRWTCLDLSDGKEIWKHAGLIPAEQYAIAGGGFFVHTRDTLQATAMRPGAATEERTISKDWKIALIKMLGDEETLYLSGVRDPPDLTAPWSGRTSRIVVLALNPDSLEQKWEADLGESRVGGFLVLARDGADLIVGAPNGIFRIDAASGSIAFHHKDPGMAPKIFTDPKIVVAESKHSIVALDRATGKKLWTLPQRGRRRSVLGPAHGTVLAYQRNTLECFDGQTGDIRWTYRGESRRSGFRDSTLRVLDDLILVGELALSRDGALQWRLRTSGYLGATDKHLLFNGRSEVLYISRGLRE